MLLAQWMLRPIHVIQSGLTRLGRGELDVRLDLPEAEFKDLDSSFAAVSAQLSESRARALTQRPTSSRSSTTSRTPSRSSAPRAADVPATRR
jgi:methyl-accepting chemotaxis protein